MRRKCLERFPRHHGLLDAYAVMLPGFLTSVFRWRKKKRSRHSCRNNTHCQPHAINQDQLCQFESATRWKKRLILHYFLNIPDLKTLTPTPPLISMVYLFKLTVDLNTKHHILKMYASLNYRGDPKCNTDEKRETPGCNFYLGILEWINGWIVPAHSVFQC